MPLSPQQNLDRLQKIVNENGVPTEFFIRFIQERGGAVTDLDALVTELEALVATFETDITALQNDKADKSIVLTAGNGLTGGGDLSTSRTFTVGTVDPTRIVVNANDIDLAPTAVTPGSYTSTDLTVDQYGRITAAANGSGGGGGGGGGGVNVYTNSNSTSGATGTTPTSMTAVISATIPASTTTRTFLVSGNIVWRDGVHPMRGAVMRDSTQVWPNTGVANAGIDPVSSTDGMDNLNFSGVIVTVPGDGASHTISLGWVSASSTGSLTLENRQITCVEITSGSSRSSNVVAKARIEWTSGGVATIIGGLNVASVTRDSAGHFTVAFTNAIPAGCTAVMSGRFGDTASNDAMIVAPDRASGKGVTTTQLNFVCQVSANTGAFDPYAAATANSWVYFEVIDPTATMISGSGGSGGSTEPGSDNFLPHISGSDVFGSGFYGGTVIYFPDAAIVDAVKFFCHSTAAGAVMTPAIYAVSAGGVLGSLVASGPSVTGAVPGIINLPLTTPYAVAAGTSLVVGFILQVSNLTIAKTKIANSVHFAHGTSVPPASPAFSLNTFNWSSMWARIQ